MRTPFFLYLFALCQ